MKQKVESPVNQQAKHRSYYVATQLLLFCDYQILSKTIIKLYQ